MDGRVDFVIIWVDGNDPEWLKEKEFWEHERNKAGRDPFADWNRGDVRYRDWNTLKYFFRGVERFAPWAGDIWFVTWGHVPSWLNTDHDKLHIVNHRDYIPEEYLPTFNSHTIELNLHRIKGLSEQFVYFNDDMFLLSPTLKTDFFKGELPCDSAVLNPVPMTRKVRHAEINNVGIINDHFDKNTVVRKNFFKWMNPLYGKYLLRNVLLAPWHRFVGFYEQHLPTSFLKTTFEEVWAAEEKELDGTCRCRFREEWNVNQWLMKNWQLAKGCFSPRPLSVGKMFVYGENGNYDQVLREIRSGKNKMMCINDGDTDDFELRKQQLLDAFETVLPDRSGYEL